MLATIRRSRKEGSAPTLDGRDGLRSTVERLCRADVGSTHLKRFAVATVLLLMATSLGACSKDTRDALTSYARKVGAEVARAAGNAADNVAEVAARNVAAKQGGEEFRKAGHPLKGALGCTANVSDGAVAVSISCSGTTEAGEKADLTGTTDELPGVSVVSLHGDFTGTANGQQVFTTPTLG